MLGYDWPRLHAALNDLPAALLLVTVLFDCAAWLTKRDSLRSAALWTLWAGVIGGWVAVVAGLRAEDAIEHGEAIHALMQKHQTLGLVTMGVFTVILAYKLFRRGRLSPAEDSVFLALGVVGAAGIVWTGTVGGKLMFEHAAGLPAATLRAEMRNREAGHEHQAGEAHEQAAPADSAKAEDHTHPPGTAPHKH
ncbi:MAG TPA: DUF2231 domain-containing protein [Gemmatimonadales bacterium]|nr:DUF2231 domain-containing protein [Gemmatimonadales bacterium]